MPLRPVRQWMEHDGTCGMLWFHIFLMITAFLERTWVTNDKQLTLAGGWFEPLWKILVSWDDYSQYIPNHQPVGNLGEIKRMRGEEVSSPLTHLGWCRFKQVALIESWLPLNLLNDRYLSVTKRQFSNKLKTLETNDPEFNSIPLPVCGLASRELGKKSPSAAQSEPVWTV